MHVVLWVFGALVGLFVLDRLLLWIESRGWIYYRRTKAGRGAATYHLLEWSSTLDPSMRQAQVEMVKEERREDESGAPPGSDSNDGDPKDSGAMSESDREA
jgi:hypothetical protein